VSAIERARFRKVLGHYPTGVCAVTSMLDGVPVGLIIGTFTSVSLDPPLVGFLPMRTSRSWQLIQATKRFCVNVLSEDQLEVCKALCRRNESRFAGVPYRRSAAGAPVLEGAVAWIDCDLESLHEAGDHFIAIGRVHALGTLNNRGPLLFFRGGYGRFTDLTSAAAADVRPGAVRWTDPLPLGLIDDPTY
jgi:3-hydroxy-9,10-secoandrosta-1,3,5(10)-triene-9,17-dione monooxygenase reductase component